jgi:YidC/Oxa1 family membrane protein insertase
MWNTLIVDPMINALLLFYNLLGENFILALTFFTVLIRMLTLPLNIRQQRSMIKTQEMQPQIQAIQKKYKDNPQKMQEEFKSIGYNPTDSLTGCLPTLIQFPILIGLYRAIIISLGSTPQSLFELVPRVYPFIDLQRLVPIENTFAWLNLSQPDPFFILPILVAGSMYIQQKLMAPPNQNKNQQDSNPAAAMTQSMQYTMPLMFGFFSLQFPSGLSIYFILANVIGIAQGWYTRRIMEKEKAELAAAKPVITASPNGTATSKSTKPASSTQSSNGSSGSKSSGSKSSGSKSSSKRKRSAKR